MYLPLCVYVITQGWNSLSPKLLYVFPAIYLAVFLYFFPGFVRERRDPVNEQELTKLIQLYKPAVIIEPDTLLAALLPEVRKNYVHYETIYINSAADLRTIAFLSTRSTPNALSYIQNQKLYNAKQQPLQPWQDSYDSYKIIYAQTRTSNIELEPNNWNSNGTNNLFFYILQL
jgi:hypothetical protein